MRARLTTLTSPWVQQFSATLYVLNHGTAHEVSSGISLVCVFISRVKTAACFVKRLADSKRNSRTNLSRALERLETLKGSVELTRMSGLSRAASITSGANAMSTKKTPKGAYNSCRPVTE